MWLFEITRAALVLLLVGLMLATVPAVTAVLAWRRARRCGGGAWVTTSTLATIGLSVWAPVPLAAATRTPDGFEAAGLIVTYVLSLVVAGVTAGVTVALGRAVCRNSGGDDGT